MRFIFIGFVLLTLFEHSFLLSQGKCKTRFDAMLIKPFLLMLESSSGFVSRQYFRAQRRVPLSMTL